MNNLSFKNFIPLFILCFAMLFGYGCNNNNQDHMMKDLQTEQVSLKKNESSVLSTLLSFEEEDKFEVNNSENYKRSVINPERDIADFKKNLFEKFRNEQILLANNMLSTSIQNRELILETYTSTTVSNVQENFKNNCLINQAATKKLMEFIESAENIQDLEKIITKLYLVDLQSTNQKILNEIIKTLPETYFNITEAFDRVFDMNLSLITKVNAVWGVKKVESKTLEEENYSNNSLSEKMENEYANMSLQREDEVTIDSIITNVQLEEHELCITELQSELKSKAQEKISLYNKKTDLQTLLTFTLLTWVIYIIYI